MGAHFKSYQAKVISMGWVNYLVVPDHKLAFEISRHVKELDEDEIKTLDNLVEQEEAERLDIGDIKLKSLDKKLNLSLNLRQLKVMLNAYDQVEKLGLMSKDTLLMYWLKKTGAAYEFMSEHVFFEKGYEKQGFHIIRPNYGGE